jgi:hypothetical protein
MNDGQCCAVWAPAKWTLHGREVGDAQLGGRGPEADQQHAVVPGLHRAGEVQQRSVTEHDQVIRHAAREDPGLYALAGVVVRGRAPLRRRQRRRGVNAIEHGLAAQFGRDRLVQGRGARRQAPAEHGGLEVGPQARAGGTRRARRQTSAAMLSRASSRVVPRLPQRAASA